MDSEGFHHPVNGEDEQNSLDSSSNLHDPIPSSFMDSSDLATTDSFNGDLHHNLSLPDFSESNNADLAAEVERSIAENQVLVDEIASLRDAHADKEQAREFLQRELHGGCERAEALSAEVASLEVEKKRHEDMAMCMVQEVRALHAEKVDLLAENVKSASENKSLDALYAETREKFTLLAKDLEQKQVAMAAAHTRVHIICFEIEKLQLLKEEYHKEVSLLDASNSTIDEQSSHLREQGKALSSEIDHILAARALAEQKVSDARATIVALSMQISTLTENDEDMKNQLREAKERLGHLQEQDNAMALKETDMESRIVDLGSKLCTLRASLDTSRQALEQETEAKAGQSTTQEVAHMKVTASDREIHILNPSLGMQETDISAKQQHVKDLQSRVLDLRKENEAMESSKEDLEAVLKTQEEPETEESNQMEENIKRLEGALNEAEERARVLELKERELKWEAQELMILVSRKQRLAGLTLPLVVSGGTIVALGLLVLILRSNSKSK
eukprot:c21485_g1_i1 orf=411-1922(-)